MRRVPARRGPCRVRVRTWCTELAAGWLPVYCPSTVREVKRPHEGPIAGCRAVLHSGLLRAHLRPNWQARGLPLGFKKSPEEHQEHQKRTEEPRTQKNSEEPRSRLVSRRTPLSPAPPIEASIWSQRAQRRVGANTRGLGDLRARAPWEPGDGGFFCHAPQFFLQEEVF